MMKTLAILGQKGGTGKTTLALGLAVEAARRGVRVAVVDLDPQANAASWRDRRATDDVRVASCVPARLAQTLSALRADGYALAIIDTAGRLDTSGMDAARVADLALVPTRVTVLDAETLPGVRDLLIMAGKLSAALVVLNGLHPAATTLADESRGVIARSCGIPVASAHMCQRTVYADAPAAGRMPQDVEPAGKAAAELAALYSLASSHAVMMGIRHA